MSKVETRTLSSLLICLFIAVHSSSVGLTSHTSSVFESNHVSFLSESNETVETNNSTYTNSTDTNSTDTNSTDTNSTESDNSTLEDVVYDSGIDILCYTPAINSLYQLGNCDITNLRNQSVEINITSSNPSVNFLSYNQFNMSANQEVTIMFIFQLLVAEEYGTSNMSNQLTSDINLIMNWTESNLTTFENTTYTFPMLGFFCLNLNSSILSSSTPSSNESRVSGLTSCSISNHLAYNLTVIFTPISDLLYNNSSTVYVINDGDIGGNVYFPINETAVKLLPHGSYYQYVQADVTAHVNGTNITFEPLLLQVSVQHSAPIDPDANPYANAGAGSGLAFLFWEIGNALDDDDYDDDSTCNPYPDCKTQSRNDDPVRTSSDNSDSIGSGLGLMLIILVTFSIILPAYKIKE